MTWCPACRDKYAPGPWKRDHAFYGKQWVNGMAHTFGGNNNVKGNLQLMATEPAAVLANPAKGNLVGWGMCPEGIETNESGVRADDRCRLAERCN